MCEQWYTVFTHNCSQTWQGSRGTQPQHLWLNAQKKKMTLSQKLQMLFTIQYLHNTDCCIVTGLLSLSSYIPIYIQLFICYIGRADLDVEFNGS